MIATIVGRGGDGHLNLICSQMRRGGGSEEDSCRGMDGAWISAAGASGQRMRTSK